MSSSLYGRLRRVFTRPNTHTLATPIKTTAATADNNRSTPDPRRLTKEERLDRLVDNFKKASDLRRFRSHYDNYSAAVLRLAKGKHFSHIEAILEYQKKYSNITDERFATRLVSLYGKCGMFDHALKVFDEMPQLNCERTVLSFNILLSACVNSKRFDKIEGLFHELPEKLSIKPDRISYNTILKAYCAMGSLNSAILMIEEMEKKGFEPDLFTYTTLLEAFYKNNRLSDAEKLWVLMENRNVIADPRTYNPKIRALVANDRISEAVDLVEKMKLKGLKPDAFGLNPLIEGFSKDGNLEEAKKWYHEMKNNECVPNRMTFRMLVPLACKKGDFDFVLELFKEARKERRIVDAGAIQNVVDELVKESKIEAVKELVEICNSNNQFQYKLKLPTDE